MEGIKREYTSDARSPIIDPELRDLLPSITDEEREALTADILKNGCYSPMICMEDRFPSNTKMYKLMTTKPSEMEG